MNRIELKVFGDDDQIVAEASLHTSSLRKASKILRDISAAIDHQARVQEGDQIVAEAAAITKRRVRKPRRDG